MTATKAATNSVLQAGIKAALESKTTRTKHARNKKARKAHPPQRQRTPKKRKPNENKSQQEEKRKKCFQMTTRSKIKMRAWSNWRHTRTSTATCTCNMHCKFNQPSTAYRVCATRKCQQSLRRPRNKLASKKHASRKKKHLPIRQQAFGTAGPRVTSGSHYRFKIIC